MLSKALVLGIICLFIGAGVVPSIGGNNINGFVDTIIVPDDYPTLQEAIDNAKNGDTIQVRAGLYRERIIIDKSINLIGENKFSTTIAGSYSGDVINVIADNVTIRGFDIRQSGTEHWEDAGIELNADFITISNNIIQYNYYAHAFFNMVFLSLFFSSHLFHIILILYYLKQRFLYKINRQWRT